MSRIHQLRSVQRLPVSLERAWEFFSDPRNLVILTPGFLILKIVGSPVEEIYAGQVILYTVTPLFGIPLSWMTEITHVEKGKRFVDEQRKGPYRLWHHQHHFHPINGGVEMTDIVHYRIPLGLAGELAHKMIVRKKRSQIFSWRYQSLNTVFGPWPGDGLRVVIE